MFWPIYSHTKPWRKNAYCTVIKFFGVTKCLILENLFIPSFRSLSCDRSKASSKASSSSFNFQYTIVSFRSSNSCLYFLPRLPGPSIFPSITYCKRQFLRKMWPIQLAFLLFIVCMIFLFSSIVCNTSSFLTRSVQLIFSSITFQHFSGFHPFIMEQKYP